jgi:hypothetical protein
MRRTAKMARSRSKRKNRTPNIEATSATGNGFLPVVVPCGDTAVGFGEEEMLLVEPGEVAVRRPLLVVVRSVVGDVVLKVEDVVVAGIGTRMLESETEVWPEIIMATLLKLQPGEYVDPLTRHGIAVPPPIDADFDAAVAAEEIGTGLPVFVLCDEVPSPELVLDGAEQPSQMVVEVVVIFVVVVTLGGEDVTMEMMEMMMPP